MIETITVLPVKNGSELWDVTWPLSADIIFNDGPTLKYTANTEPVTFSVENFKYTGIDGNLHALDRLDGRGFCISNDREIEDDVTAIKIQIVAAGPFACFHLIVREE